MAMPKANYGQLSIRPICCSLHQQVKDAARDHPFVEVTIGNTRLASSIATKQRIDPAWLDRFDYQLSGETKVDIFVYDHEHRKKEDFSGKATIDLAEPLANRNHVGMYNVLRDGKITGFLKLAFEFIPQDDKVKEV